MDRGSVGNGKVSGSSIGMDYKTLVAQGLLDAPPPSAGRYQYGVLVHYDVSQEEHELFFEGDVVTTSSDGALVILREKPNRCDVPKSWLSRLFERLRRRNGQEYETLLMIASGKWEAVYLTSPITGEPIACHHWPELGIDISHWIRRGGR